MSALVTLAPPPVGLSMDQVRIRRIRGPNVGLARRWFMKRGGEAGWQNFLSTLSDRCEEAFSGPIGLYEWVDEADYTELSLAFLGYAHSHDAYRAGEVAAREQLTTINRWILRVLSPSFLISNLPRLWAFYLDGGAVHIERLEPGFAALSLYGAGCIPEFYHPGLSGWIHAALALTGADNIDFVYVPPEPGAHGIDACRHYYELSWD